MSIVVCIHTYTTDRGQNQLNNQVSRYIYACVIIYVYMYTVMHNYTHTCFIVCSHEGGYGIISGACQVATKEGELHPDTRPAARTGRFHNGVSLQKESKGLI